MDDRIIFIYFAYEYNGIKRLNFTHRGIDWVRDYAATYGITEMRLIKLDRLLTPAEYAELQAVLCN